MKALIALALSSALLMGSCMHRPRPVPRRTAYPRVEALPDSMVSRQLGNISVQINSSAITVQPKEGWMNVSYPVFGATLHLTSSPYRTPQQLTQTLENRLERMSLNLGDTPARELKFTNDAGFECTLLAAESGATPLQLLAVGPDEVFSGVVVFNGSTTPVDSIAPIIKELDQQMITLLKNLRRAD